MARPGERDRESRDVGSRSPVSEEAKDQEWSGARGGPRAGRSEGTQPQPPQASGRRGAGHEQPPTVRKGFEPGRAPSEQGEKDHPSPHVIARHQQGIEPRSGSHTAHGERSEEEAQRGEPRGEHARHGRQHLPGDRSGD